MGCPSNSEFQINSEKCFHVSLHRLNGHEFEQTPGGGKGQEACCGSVTKSDTTERLNNKYPKYCACACMRVCE